MHHVVNARVEQLLPCPCLILALVLVGTCSETRSLLFSNTFFLMICAVSMLFYIIFPYVRNGKMSQTNIKSLSLETVPQVEGSPLLVMSVLSFVAVFFSFPPCSVLFVVGGCALNLWSHLLVRLTFMPINTNQIISLSGV